MESVAGDGPDQWTPGIIPPDCRTGLYLFAMALPCGNIAVKIGISKGPHKRCASLSTGCPFEYMMKWTPLGSFNDVQRFEKHLHKVFKDNHTRREWFLFSPEDSAKLNETVDSEIKRVFLDFPGWHKIEIEEPEEEF